MARVSARFSKSLAMRWFLLKFPTWSDLAVSLCLAHVHLKFREIWPVVAPYRAEGAFSFRPVFFLIFGLLRRFYFGRFLSVKFNDGGILRSRDKARGRRARRPVRSRNIAVRVAAKRRSPNLDYDLLHLLSMKTRIYRIPPSRTDDDQARWCRAARPYAPTDRGETGLLPY